MKLYVLSLVKVLTKEETKYNYTVQGTMGLCNYLNKNKIDVSVQ